MIVYYTVLFISFFLIALILRSSRGSFYALAENSVALVNQLLSGKSEDVKVKLVQKSTNKLVISLLKILLVGIVAVAVGSVPIIIYCIMTGKAFHALVFSSFYSILSISLGATVPFLLPFSKKNNSGYSELSRLLHRIALDNYYAGYKLFKQETKKIKKRNLERRPDFVIISGLARTGTTSLMNDLSRVGDFVSLNYANMPFLMCPNIWAKFYKPANSQLKERSHKDGIKIGFNSNEALEEYFFKVKADDSYISESALSEYAISQDDYDDYLDYQSIIKLDNRKIYLAKNNNFLLRYKSVRNFNQEFLMVILYREPLTHAASLLEKHREYKKLQREDPFVLEYMNWLGHHEFGENQKQFSFQSSERIQDQFLPHSSEENQQVSSQSSERITDSDKEALDYWLKIWINYYSFALTIHHPNTLFINYDSYCATPKEIIESILRRAGIDTQLPDYKSFSNTRRSEDEYSKDIYTTAREIYEELKTR